MSTGPEKIAILGGGVSAMTAAFYLTDKPNWQDKYDITVYQMGWRIGGKGASGRNPEYGERIEEHGLHIWFGFYENAFTTIKKAYDLLDRPPGAPLRTWQDAFKPHSYIALSEYIDEEWKMWNIDFPTNNLVPGTRDEDIDIWDLFRTAYMWLKKILEEIGENEEVQHKGCVVEDDDDDKNWFEELADDIGEAVEDIVDDIRHTVNHLETMFSNLPALFKDHDEGQLKKHGVIHGILNRLKKWLNKEISELLDDNDDLRRLFISADLGLTILIGMIEDGVFEHGFDVINNYDYREWLRKHGANEKYTVDSAPVRGFYDLVFAYEGGDFSKPNVEAGTIIRSMMRIALCYQGAVMWKMQAGMGDTIFTPFYQALKDRGVKFEYFHKVEELLPDADGDSVAEIRMTKQVALKEGLTDYDPLVPVKGLPCWPSTPKYGLLNPEQATLLQDNNINLESFWTDWPSVYENHYGEPLPQISLKQGEDFDKVIFGISVGALPHLCPKLLELSPRFKTMSDKVKTVVTQAYQVWGDKDLCDLGWHTQPEGQEPVLSGFVEPFDTWASMSQLLKEEDWPADLEPKNVSYFCSAQTVSNFPPASDHSFPAKCAAQVKENAINNLTQSIYNLWPDVASKGEFDWGILIDPHQQEGAARFDSQYWRSNIDPSERYVLSVKGSTKYRLGTNETGFGNLYITGDWIKTGLNAGCVEAATMAGMQTSRAISGYPQKIKGEKDF